MASVVYRKQDKIDFKTTCQKHEEPIYVNTQDESTAEPNEIYYVLNDVDKESVQDKPSKKRVWQQLKDKAVLILYVVQGLTLIALAAVSATLFLMGHDPVNGGWSMWTEWGQCSSTCGVGQQRHNRLCTNPEPKFGGKHCEGESLEYRICMITSCTSPLNGGWTMWTEWGLCSSTCGVGQQRRNRMCFNPEPKFGGKHCEGESSDYRICSAINCTALDGGWTEWISWGKCSSTCGTGLQRRERTCTNPETEFGGKHCNGDPSESRLCNASKCIDGVGFAAYNSQGFNENGENRLYFSNLIYTSDNSFNTTGGVFTCNIPGMYVFTATIATAYGYSSGYCYIKVNGSSVIQIFASGYSSSYASTSGTMVLKLSKYDTVYLGSCSYPSYLYSYGTSFSGILVSPDQD